MTQSVVDPSSENVLLLTLREVSDLVSNSHDLRETLSNIVELIQRRFRSDVCSVYTVDKATGDLVLSATVGLRPECVGNLRMPIQQGLVGLAAEKREPVNVSDASQHPRYRYFPESGEEQFPAFLGVPLIQGGVVQGVMVIQHRDNRAYKANQVSLVMGIAAQLATLVTNARLTQELSETVYQRRQADHESNGLINKPADVHGTAACPGIAYGRALRFEVFDFDSPNLVARPAGTVAEERALLAAAIEKGRHDLDLAAEHLAELLGEQFGALMQAQRFMLEDKTVQTELYRLVDFGDSVEQAVVRVCGEYLRAFEKLDNPFFYERIYDIKDVFRRVLDHASPSAARNRQADAVIVVAAEVSLLELFASDVTRIRGIVVERGGAFSHVAILARSLGIPMLVQAHRIVKCVEDGDELFIDAASGVVAINPEPARRKILLGLMEEKTPPNEPETFAVDIPLRLEATVNLLPEVARTVRNGAEAVGLYRSEFLQLARRSLPTEEEQLDIYRKMIALLDGRPLTIRTLDLRADKLFGIQTEKQSEKTWEWRLVDESPHVQELIRIQLRAILRAAESGPVRILFPMIATQRQFTCALKLVDEARRSLRIEGLPFGDPVPLGLMVEVPAAVMMVRRWAEKVDFISIGSNDLLHSLLGVERDDDALVRLKTPLEPSYLRAVRHVVKHAQMAGKPVTVCGEAASHPQAILALAALGVNAVSVPPDDIPKIRRQFAGLEMPSNFQAIGRRLAAAADANEVALILDQAFLRRS